MISQQVPPRNASERCPPPTQSPALMMESRHSHSIRTAWQETTSHRARLLPACPAAAGGPAPAAPDPAADDDAIRAGSGGEAGSSYHCRVADAAAAPAATRRLGGAAAAAGWYLAAGWVAAAGRSGLLSSSSLSLHVESSSSSSVAESSTTAVAGGAAPSGVAPAGTNAAMLWLTCVRHAGQMRTSPVPLASSVRAHWPHVIKSPACSEQVQGAVISSLHGRLERDRRTQDCHFDDTPFLSSLKHLI